MDIAVTKWISYDEAETMRASIGGMGGWFGIKGRGDLSKAGHRWADYLNSLPDVGRPYAEAIRASVLEHNLRIHGDEHQGEEGVPLFSDGTVGTFTCRAWGDIMAAIWSEAEDKDYCYMDFYA